MRDVCWRILVLSASVCLFTACEDQDTIKEDGTEVTWPEPPPRDRDTYICDPVDPDGPIVINPSHARQGVRANLFYLPEDAPHYKFVDDYLDYGLTFDDVDIYFNQLNVPTRPFDKGFVTEGGTTLMTPEGGTLYEWFALDIHGKIKLNSDQLPGDYQFAILADDGVILEMDMDDDGVFETIVDNDGFHPTKMGCDLNSVYFDSHTSYNVRIKYFQGPRYHISLVVMMRPFPELPTDVEDPLCGRQGNSLFFDSTQSPPEPQPAFYELESRGWEVLRPENYLLPDEDQDNPCDDPPPVAVAPVISNTILDNVTSSSARLSWETDIAATSQVEILDVLSGSVVNTTEEIISVTIHSVSLSGLMSNRLYRVTAISKEPTGLTSRSLPIDFRTSR